MSSMLAQALIDAGALKEAALKNAETAILERYASDVKNTMNSLLEQEEDMGMELADEDPEAGIPDAATQGEKLCPCPDDEEVKTFTFTMADMRTALDSMDDAPEEDSEDLAVDMGAVDDEEEEELALQEVLEIDEQLLFEYPEDDEDDKELLMKEEEEEEEDEPSGEAGSSRRDRMRDRHSKKAPRALEETLPEGIDIEKLVEEVIIELSGDELSGWGGDAGSRVEYGKEIRLARQASTEARERTAQLNAALGELSESSKTVADQNRILKQTLKSMKEKLEEVNLSNAKLLYMNRTLNSPSLNERQRSKIVESIQNSDSVEEAKVIYETLQSAVGSSKRTPKSLREVINRPSISVPSRKNNTQQRDVVVKERFQRLAGISKTD